MKKTAVLVLIAAVTGLCADDETVNRVFQLKYANADRLANVIRAYGAVNANEQLKAITVQSRKSVMPEIEQIIQRFDVPPPPVQNIEVTIYLMSALGQPSSSLVPPELEPVVKQLKGMFSYKGYQLIDTQVIRVRAGQGGEASGVVDNAAKSENKAINQIKFRAASVSIDEKGRAVRIDGLRVGLRIPITSADRSGAKQYQYLDTGISTDVDIREGQKVVVGKANMDSSERASIVVLTARVVE